MFNSSNTIFHRLLIAATKKIHVPMTVMPVWKKALRLVQF